MATEPRRMTLEEVKATFSQRAEEFKESFLRELEGIVIDAAFVDNGSVEPE